MLRILDQNFQVGHALCTTDEATAGDRTSRDGTLARNDQCMMTALNMIGGLDVILIDLLSGDAIRLDEPAVRCRSKS